MPHEEPHAHNIQARLLAQLLHRSFADPVSAAAWLEREVPLLGGQRPIDLIRRGQLEPVIEVLATGQAGGFV